MSSVVIKNNITFYAIQTITLILQLKFKCPELSFKSRMTDCIIVNFEKMGEDTRQDQMKLLPL